MTQLKKENLFITKLQKNYLFVPCFYFGSNTDLKRVKRISKMYKLKVVFDAKAGALGQNI